MFWFRTLLFMNARALRVFLRLGLPILVSNHGSSILFADGSLLRFWPADRLGYCLASWLGMAVGWLYWLGWL